MPGFCEGHGGTWQMGDGLLLSQRSDRDDDDHAGHRMADLALTEVTQA